MSALYVELEARRIVYEASARATGAAFVRMAGVASLLPGSPARRPRHQSHRPAPERHLPVDRDHAGRHRGRGGSLARHLTTTKDNPMHDSIIQATSIEIAGTLADLEPLRDAAASFAAERTEIEHGINAAVQAASGAASDLARVQVEHRLGKADASALRLATDAANGFDKAAIKASSRASEVARLVMVEQKLAADLAPLEALVIKLRTVLANAEHEARMVALEDSLRSEVETYSQLAEQTMRSLALAMARHQHLVEVGREPGLLNAGVAGSMCGSFNGRALTTNVQDVLKVERQRIAGIR